MAAAAVAVAVVLVAGASYMVVRSQLLSELDQTLTGQAARVQRFGEIVGFTIPGLPANAGGSAPYQQIVTEGGDLVARSNALPVDATVLAVADGKRNSAFEDITVAGAPARLYVFRDALNDGTPVAVELARPLTQDVQVLSHLKLILLLLAAGGVLLAAALGRLAARRVIAPLAEVARSAEHISETEDLSTRIRVRTQDEVGQLAERFNAMLERLQRSRAELDESVQAQRQLVADASHELRTPVTSLRTNVEVLLAGVELDPEDRQRLLDDVVEQTEELSSLVNDLIEVARGDLPLTATEELRLDAVVDEALQRARRNATGIRFDGELEPVVVRGVAERLARAIGNLLDNAARHSEPGGRVEVRVDQHGVEVRDHGTGIEEADLPHIFDRFYRGVNARGRQGSGLGLAIVRQVVEQHGGRISAGNADGGGAVFRLELPTLPAPRESTDAPRRDEALFPHGAPRTEDAPRAEDAQLKPVAAPGPAPGERL